MIGATATGKSAIAMAVAQLAGDVDLISVDSMQVYRGMDIGTAKPSAAEQAAVRHHCIDLVDPSEEFSVAEFKSAHRAALADIADRGRRAVLVGGTGLYHRVVIDDFDLPGEWPDARAELAAVDDTPSLFERLRAVDPAAAEKMEPGNRRRIIRALEVTIGSGRPFSSFGPGVDHYPPSPVVQIGVRRPRAVVAELIAARVRRMVASGLVDEVRTVAGSGFGRTAAQALGYKEILEHLAGRVSEDEAVETIITRTRQFAVRQERWFRRDPRVRWIDVDDDPVSDVTPIVLDALDHR